MSIDGPPGSLAATGVHDGPAFSASIRHEIGVISGTDSSRLIPHSSGIACA